MTVGAPAVLKAFGESFLSAFLFIGGFYVLLVGSKIFVALLVDRSRSFLRGPVYIATIRKKYSAYHTYYYWQHFLSKTA